MTAVMIKSFGRVISVRCPTLTCVLAKKIHVDTVKNETSETDSIIIPDHIDLNVCSEWGSNNDDILSIRNSLLNSMKVFPNFISSEEEEVLVSEVEPTLKKMTYQFDHWDDAIQGFKETERGVWSEPASIILERARNLALQNSSTALPYIHILDLDSKGHIKPHVDAVRFCGDTVAGICLLSPAVMRFRHSNNKDLFADFLLTQYCFYIMLGSSRYDFTHEILHNDVSYFKKKYIERERRISVIIRNRP